MYKPFKALPFILAAGAVSSQLCVAHAAEPEITEDQPIGTYSMAAKRVHYTGEKAKFSLDIPAELDPQIVGGEPLDVGDGSTQWELFYAEDISPSIECCFHQSEGGYESEMSSWQGMLTDPEYKLEILTGDTLDGSEFSIVDIHFEYGDRCDEVVIAEYPLDEGTWLNVSFGAEHSVMDGYRGEIYSMLETFSKEKETASGTVPQAPGTDKSSPDTGVGVPAAALISAVGAAAVMTACARK